MQELQCRFWRLPGELRSQIYEYTLIAEKPIIVWETLSFNTYFWRERCERENREGELAMKFLIWNSPGADWNDAHAFLLRNNTFKIQTKACSELLVKHVSSLCELGYSTHVKSLVVQIPHDEIGNESEDVGVFIDPKDYEEGDNKAAGLRAFRILKPLLELPRLDSVQIVLRQHKHGNRIFLRCTQTNPGLERVAAVIARLRDLVFATSRAPKFEVLLQDINRNMVWGTGNIARLWEALNPAETERMRQWTHILQQLGKYESDCTRIRRLSEGRKLQGESKSGGEDRMDGWIKEIQKLRIRIDDLHRQHRQFILRKQNYDSRNRYHVARMARDMNWEQQVELISKMPTLEELGSCSNRPERPSNDECIMASWQTEYWAPHSDDEKHDSSDSL